MKKNKPECASPGDHSTSDEFLNVLFPVRPLAELILRREEFRDFSRGRNAEMPIGFTATDRELTVNGIRFTPMEYNEQ